MQIEIARVDEHDVSDYRRAKRRNEITIGDSVRVVRELQELTQSQLSQVTGIPRSTISVTEHNRISLTVERAEALARVLRVHPSVLAFPG